MSERKVVIPYKPRPQLVSFHDRKQRWAAIVAHRRFGKTVGCVNDLVKAAAKVQKLKNQEPRFGYFMPTYSQAKDVAWGYLKYYAGAIPGTTFNESELRAVLPNQATVRLYGTENYDRLRGIGLHGAVLDEFGDMDPRAWTQVIRPALSDNKGWGVFIGTPKGQNHFYDLTEQAKNDDAWYYRVLKASQTGILDEQELADARRMMTAEQYASEYECSFFGAVVGAYYGQELADLDSQGGIGDFGWLPRLSVSTVWDTGNTTGIWFFQKEGSQVRIIDYYEGNNLTAAQYKKQLDSLPYTYGEHFVPADADDEKEITAMSWKATLEGLGVKNIHVLPRQTSVDNGINAAKLLIPRCRFNVPNVPDGQHTKAKDGVTGLRNYRRQWDDKRKTFRDQPLHDWASHPADAFRYLAIAVEFVGETSNWSKPLQYKQKWT